MDFLTAMYFVLLVWLHLITQSLADDTPAKDQGVAGLGHLSELCIDLINDIHNYTCSENIIRAEFVLIEVECRLPSTAQLYAVPCSDPPCEEHLTAPARALFDELMRFYHSKCEPNVNSPSSCEEVTEIFGGGNEAAISWATSLCETFAAEKGLIDNFTMRLVECRQDQMKQPVYTRSCDSTSYCFDRLTDETHRRYSEFKDHIERYCNHATKRLIMRRIVRNDQQARTDQAHIDEELDDLVVGMDESARKLTSMTHNANENARAGMQIHSDNFTEFIEEKLSHNENFAQEFSNIAELHRSEQDRYQEDTAKRLRDLLRETTSNLDKSDDIYLSIDKSSSTLESKEFSWIDNCVRCLYFVVYAFVSFFLSFIMTAFPPVRPCRGPLYRITLVASCAVALNLCLCETMFTKPILIIHASAFLFSFVRCPLTRAVERAQTQEPEAKMQEVLDMLSVRVVPRLQDALQWENERPLLLQELRKQENEIQRLREVAQPRDDRARLENDLSAPALKTGDPQMKLGGAAHNATAEDLSQETPYNGRAGNAGIQKQPVNEESTIENHRSDKVKLEGVGQHKVKLPATPDDKAGSIDRTEIEEDVLPPKHHEGKSKKRKADTAIDRTEIEEDVLSPQDHEVKSKKRKADTANGLPTSSSKVRKTGDNR